MTDIKAQVLHLLQTKGLIPNQVDLGVSNSETTENLHGISNELEYSSIYKQLLRELDELMTFEYADETVYDGLLAEIDIPHIDKSNEEELLRYLKRVQEIRRLIIQNSMITLPILRAVHHVQGIPSKETLLRDKIEERDELSLQIIQKQDKVRKLRQQSQELKQSNSKLLQSSQSLVQNLPIHKDLEDPESIKILKTKLEEAKKKSYDMSEEIQLLLVNNGINWSQDPNLLEIVKLCGEVYND